jgi:hypothetical protein
MALTKVPSNLDATVSTTQSASDNSTKVATTAYVTTAISALSDSAPAALNTLNEIAAALGDDANYASTTTAAIAAKLPLAGGTMTGNIAHASDFTLDVGGDISLDADGEQIRFKDGGTEIGHIDMGSQNLTIRSKVNNKDIEFHGTNGSGANVAALKLDMSNAGRAIFNVGASFQDHVYLADNDKLVLGGGDDLQIYHNGSHSYIDNNKGALFIRNNVDDDDNNNIILQAKSGEYSIICDDDGAVTLYHDNSAKLATTSTGTHTSGTSISLKTTGSTANDRSGAGFAVTESSTDSSRNARMYLDADNGAFGTGNSGTYFYMEKIGGGGEVRFINQDNAAIQLITNGSRKTLTLSGNNLHLNGGTDARIQFGTSGAGATSTSNDTVHIRGDSDSMKLMTAANGHYIFEENGNEHFRIESGGNVGIGTNNPSSLLHIHNDSVAGNTQLHIHNNKTGDAAVLKLEGKRTSLNDTGQILFANNGNLVAKIDARSAADDGELRFFTSATGSGSGISQRMVIDGSGKISIGNNNPVWSGSYGGGLFLKGNNSTSDRYARLAIVDSTGAETSSGNLTLANNGVVTINREVNGSGSTSYENILKISRTGGATNNGQREAAISFFDSDNATYTAMITGVRTSPAGNYNGGLSIYTNSHAQNANASSISEMVSGKAVHFDASQSATFYGDIYINGANDKLQQNGVGRIAKAGVINGNQTVSYTVEHSNQSSLHIRCAMQHYGIMTSYGTALDGVYGNGSGGLFSVLVTQHTTATSGSWSVTRVDSDTLTITKNAGNYAGGGYYYIIVEGANLV